MRTTEICPNCGKEADYCPGSNFLKCENCGIKGVIKTYKCPRCESFMAVINRIGYCPRCGIKKTADELDQLRVANHDEEKWEIKNMMEQKPGF